MQKNGAKSVIPVQRVSDETTIFDDDRLMEKLVGDAVVNAIREHKAAGNPIADWQDGRVVMIPPDEIVLPEEDEVVTPASGETPPTYQ